MMPLKKKLPLGIENFGEFFSENFYYIDKTGLLIDLLHNWGKVNLFTRPRRFGKSLNMSMLQSFFEIGADETLFAGLKIAQEKELCEQYMGQFPVVSISLKDVTGSTFESACTAMQMVLGREAMKFDFLLKSEHLTDMQKNMYRALVEVGKDGCFTMTMPVMTEALKTLCDLLSKHYGRKVILLIDEYDVPLDKAFQLGYYDEMVSFVRNIFSNALKTNPYLQFAVLTGCLRISKESIFMGLNNLNVLSITDAHFDEYFGFTDKDVREILSYYELEEFYDTMKEWYDGYQFGNVAVYCPWDVIKYCYALLADKTAPPEDYWSNTSSNSIVRRFIDKANRQTKDEIERLVAGEVIVKEIRQELTYNELDRSIDNLWSVLFTTGYLTQHGREGGKKYKLAIPNKEIRELFTTQIQEWFDDNSARDTSKLDEFCEAFPLGDEEAIERLLNDYLWNTISIRDVAVKKERKENFYHGILLGLLKHKENWLVLSNVESGEGYADILIEVPESRTGIVVEMKYAEAGKLDAGCEKALAQIEEKSYPSRLLSDGMRTVVKCGIACFRKCCRVKCQ
jgi:hypothetical protein